MCADDGASHRGGRGQPRRAGVETVRDRRVVVRPFPPSRRLVTAAVRAGRRIMPMHGLFDVDISTARRRLAEHDPPLSFTAFVIASLGRAAAIHPEVHAYRDWRGRLVQHRHVDVQTLIEVPTSRRPVRAGPRRPRRRHPQRHRHQRRDPGSQEPTPTPPEADTCSKHSHPASDAYPACTGRCTPR